MEDMATMRPEMRPEMRQDINDTLKQASKNREAKKVSTLRLVNAAIKDRDIAARSSGNYEGISDDEILALLQSMIKQRRESIKMYEQAGRQELADGEAQEIEIIEAFLPEQLSEEEIKVKIDEAVEQTGASSIKDMGAVMGFLKENYTGQMDFGKASGLVKQQLA